MTRDFTTTTLNYPQGADTPIKRVMVNRPPKTGTVDSDFKNFTPGDEWLDTANYNWWKFVRVSGSPPIGIWVLLGSGNLEFLTGNSGGAISADPSNNINILGTGQINVAGTLATHTLTISTTSVATVTGNFGGAVSPDPFNNLNIVGSGGVIVTGTPLSNTLTITGIPLDITWQIITINTVLTKDNGYFTNGPGPGPLQVFLPGVSVIGDTLEIADISGFGFQIVQGAGQQVRLGIQLSTAGVAGSITSVGNGAHLELVCVVANTLWIALEPNGNFLVV